MKRHGKIARLSRERQHELNCRLQNGEPGVKLLDWLNGLPEMAVILKADFGGLPVSKQNLSEWANGGFKEWQARQENRAGILGLAGDAEELEVATQGRLADRLATVLAGRYATLLKDWDGQVTEEFSKQQKMLRAMIQDLAHLRRWDHSAARVRMEQAVHAANQELTNEALFEQFEQWAKKGKIQEYLKLDDRTPKARARKAQARGDLLQTEAEAEAAEAPADTPQPESSNITHGKPAPPAAQAPESNPVQVSPSKSNLSIGAETANLLNATPVDAPSDPQSAPQTPDARPQTQPPASSTPSPEANSTPKPSQTLTNSTSTPPPSVNPCQPPASGVGPACPHIATTPGLPPVHQPPSARPSAIPINGGAGRGEQSLVKNLPSASPSPATGESSFQNPPQTLDARPRTPTPVSSPCLGVCQFNDGGFCKTCFRNTIEKANWPTLVESARAQVVAACARRKANQHPSRRSDPENVPAN